MGLTLEDGGLRRRGREWESRGCRTGPGTRLGCSSGIAVDIGGEYVRWYVVAWKDADCGRGTCALCWLGPSLTGWLEVISLSCRHYPSAPSVKARKPEHPASQGSRVGRSVCLIGAREQSPINMPHILLISALLAWQHQ